MKTKKQKNIFILIIFCFTISALACPFIVQAGWMQDLGLGEYGLVPDRCASGSGCTIDDFVVLAVNIANLILGISGSIALVFFVYGGIFWIISSGNTNLVDKGRKTLTNAVIGLAIIFGSWLIINFILAALTSQNPWAEMKDVRLFRGESTERKWSKPFESVEHERTEMKKE